MQPMEVDSGSGSPSTDTGQMSTTAKAGIGGGVCVLLVVSVWYAGSTYMAYQDCLGLSPDLEGYWRSLMLEKLPADGGKLPETNLLILGDSNADYWQNSSYCAKDGDRGACNKEFFDAQNITTVNYGVGGSTCYSLVAFTHILQPRGSTPIDTILYICGGNDLVLGRPENCHLFGNTEPKGRSPLNVMPHSEMIMERLTSEWPAGVGSPRVILPSLSREIGVPQYWPLEAEYDGLVKAHVQKLADANPSKPPILWLDMAGFLEPNNDASIYDKDKIHFNAKGYALWNEFILSAMQNAPANCAIWNKDKTCGYPASAKTNAFRF